MCIYPAVAGSFETVVCVELYVFDPPFFMVALLPADLLMYDVCQGGFLSLGSTA